MIREPMQPDGIADGDVIQGVEQGTEVRASILENPLLRELGNGVVKPYVHPAIVFGHEGARGGSHFDA